MGRLRARVSETLRRRVQALVEPRVAMAEAVCTERLAELSARITMAEDSARQTRDWRAAAHEATSADLRALMMRLDGMALRIEALGRAQEALTLRVETEAACRQSQADTANGDITAMLHRLEQVRRELRHEMELIVPADG